MLIGKARTATIIALTAYTALMLYFLYFGFERINSVHDGANRYNLIPDGIRLSLPTGNVTWFWFYNFANFAAFLPYGMFVPRLVSVRFLRFLGLFLVTISILEALQWATGLGSFDIDDILTNVLGGVVGYMAQRWVPRTKDTLKGIGMIFAAAALFSLGTIIAVQGINHWIAKATSVEAGREVGIDSLPVKEGLISWDPSPAGFEVGGHEMEPQVNLLSRENPGSTSVTYALDGKYLTFTGNMGVPDDIPQGESTVVIAVDGEVSESTVSSENASYFEMDVYGAKELTIAIRNENDKPNTNVVLWDMILTEIKNR
ncbi:VanZ family protein [Paenibacillus woosongensis]|uniref:VanZ family protein n=1 Tax=Paenibacillus woosongensis TaxID=307580 RepID=A0ABQ4MSW5_9BACL|nr:VanZ family protein [Paenibacillus woosongensis]GIP59019.1 hypothetical protein J15TS10_28330 [Paenibacillus woosongensis]